MAASAPLVLPLRTLYRLALATARHFDEHPALKALMPLLNLTTTAAGSTPPSAAASSLALAHQRAFLQRGCSAAQHDTPTARLFSQPVESLTDYVRAAYREAEGGGSVSVRLEAAAACQRELTRAADLAEVVAASSEGRALGHPTLSRLVARHLEGQLAEASSIRPGVMLLEHPASLRPGRACVLVYDIARDAEGPSGGEEWVLRGYVLNRPLPGTAGDCAGGDEGVLGQHLSALPIFHGGDAAGGGLSIVHRFSDLPSAQPIEGRVEDEGGGRDDSVEGGDARCGLFVGGDVDAINARLSSGRASASDFRVTLGHVELPLVKDAGGGLALPEADRWLVAAGPGVGAMSLCAPLTPLFQKPPVDALPGYDFLRFAHQNAAWEHAIRTLAGWVEVADAPRGRCVAAFASSLAHASTAHYIAGGLRVEELVAMEGEKQRLLEAAAVDGADAIDTHVTQP